jgi:hypothetical protein
MFRKAFIRLIMVIAVATTTLIVFAARQNAVNSTNESCESKKDGEPAQYTTEFMILESIGRTLISTGTN